MDRRLRNATLVITPQQLSAGLLFLRLRDKLYGSWSLQKWATIFKGLTPPQQYVLYTKLFIGLSLRQIADDMGVVPHKVRMIWQKINIYLKLQSLVIENLK